MDSKPRPARPALRQGLIFGVILAVVEVVLPYISGFLGSALLIDLVAIVIFLGFGYFAGRRAAASTGRLGTGALAGFLTGLIGTLLPSIVLFVYYLFNLDAIRQTLQKQAAKGSTPITNGDIIFAIILSSLQNLLLPVLITLIGGAIGGFLVRRRVQEAKQGEQLEQESESLHSPPSKGQ
jgi:hypothetical protein